MTPTDMPKVHEGRNVKGFREMLGIKQEVLAADLGLDAKKGLSFGAKRDH
jgi:hypothetical protein